MLPHWPLAFCWMTLDCHISRWPDAGQYADTDGKNVDIRQVGDISARLI
jgi:hypothetical protein